MKLTKTQNAKLDCICGACEHDCMDKKCLFNKITESMHPEAVQKKYILDLMEEVLVANTPKNTRAKITTKKGKK